jgi:hypothetical protein
MEPLLVLDVCGGLTADESRGCSAGAAAGGEAGTLADKIRATQKVSVCGEALTSAR